MGVKQKRKQRSERENSVSSKISSIFRGNPKKKKKKDKKRRRSSTLSKLLSFGSKSGTDNTGNDEEGENAKYEKVDQSKNTNASEEYTNDEQEPLSNDYVDDEDVDG